MVAPGAGVANATLPSGLPASGLSGTLVNR